MTLTSVVNLQGKTSI